MKTKKVIFGALAGTVTMFLCGFLIYGVLLSSYMAANANTAVALPMEQMKFPVMILSNFMWALLFTLIIDWSGVQTAMAGAKTGAITGFLGLLGVTLTLFATTTLHNNNMTYVLVDAIAFAVMSGISGAVIAWVTHKVTAQKTATA